jgi:glycosyltransferase involved in cell wall biosynthesis
MLSVCIIAKNEERNIERCLKSVVNIADEIILIDTGSEDNTVNIAKRFNCKIHHKKWNDNFSDMRNISLSKASEEYILYIDADEELQNPEVLKIVMMNANENHGGFYVSVLSTASDNSRFFSNYQVRLFKNNPNFKFEGAIHEQIINSIKKNGYEIAATQIILKHYGYDLEKSDFLIKQNRNLRILLKELKQNPENTFQRINIAKTYFALNMPEYAELEIKKLLQKSNLNSIEKVQILNYGALISNKLNNKTDAYDRAKKSVELLKEQFLSNFILAEVSLEKGDYKQATKYYKDCINFEVNLKNKIIGDMMPDKAKIFYKTGLALLKDKNYLAAINEFTEGLKHSQNDLQNLTGLANAYYKIREFEKSLDVLYKVRSIFPDIKEISEFISKVESQISKKSVVQELPLLTLSMIVKNEEKYLEDCIKSVSGIADEIVIVDTGSSDNTKEIATKYTDKIFDFKWADDFSAARNEALKHSTGKWILYMDADERFNYDNVELFKDMLENATDNIGGFIVTIESDHKKLDGSSERHRGGYPRIFRNLGYPKIKFQGRVHEQIAPSLIDLNMKFVNSDIIIEHLGYNKDYDEMDKKVRRNYKLLLQHVKEEPLNGYAWFQLGQTLGHMNLKEQSEDAILFAINTGNLNDSVYASACATLAQLTGNRKEFDKSLYYSEESLKKAPDQIYSLNLKAYSLLYLGRKKEAETEFLKVLELMKSKKGIPKSGFDIDIPESVVINGLNKSRE